MTKNPKSSRGTADPPEQPGFSLISNEKLIAIYVAMVKCRMLEQRAATLFQQGKLASDFHASAGREACAVAVGIDLKAEDVLSTAPGDWLSTFIKGLPLEALFRTLAPTIDGHPAMTTGELQRRNILTPSPGADQIQLLLDRAVVAQNQKKGVIVAAFLDPAPDSPDQWQKAMAAASHQKLPIVFVHPVSDAGQPDSENRKTKGKTPQALFHGVPAIGVDAADPVALYRVAYEAITRARQNRGATLLQCTTVPVATAPSPADTTTPPTPPGPIAAMEAYLKRKGIEPEHAKSELITGFTRELDVATRFVEC